MIILHKKMPYSVPIEKWKFESWNPKELKFLKMLVFNNSLSIYFLYFAAKKFFSYENSISCVIFFLLLFSINM